jgi:hypothetical protein
MKLFSISGICFEHSTARNGLTVYHETEQKYVMRKQLK